MHLKSSKSLLIALRKTSQRGNGLPDEKHRSDQDDTNRAFHDTMTRLNHVRQHYRVILTGSTGNLGAYLLNELLASPQCRSVTCLNRSDDAGSRQKLAAHDKGLDQLDLQRMNFLTANLAEPHLGLTKSDYQSLIRPDTFTIILHNAWPVNFNRHFSSFEPSIVGVRNLVDLTLAHGKAQAALMFISSISVAANWGAIPGALSKVPESEIDDWRLARMGYGQSKLVSERMIAEACRTAGMIGAICRVGQVAGPVQIQARPTSDCTSKISTEKSNISDDGSSSVKHTFGSSTRPHQKTSNGPMWPKSEWLPSLIASSAYLKVLPESLGPLNDIAWVPVDTVARTVRELVEHTTNQKSGVIEFHHIVNPTTCEWSTLSGAIQDYFGDSVEIVSLAKWVDILKDSISQVQTADEAERNPAVKLAHYFDNLADKALRTPRARQAIFDTKLTVGRCSLGQLQPVDSKWLTLWLDQWSFEALL